MASATSKYNVFLRIKPLDVQNVDDRMNSEILNAIDSSSITLSHTNKNNEVIKCQYKFDKVFKPSASQSELFNDVLRPKLCDFLQGKDSLVFSYGTSNSGKSFTMQGTRDQPGIIPRVLHAIYHSIQGHIDTELNLKPFKSCQATVVNEDYKNTLCAEKSAILESLHGSRTEFHDTSLSGTTSEQVTMHLEESHEIPCCLRDDEVCTVWISFYELYNEQIFDLLAFNPTSLQHPLKLGYDNEDDSYHPVELKVIDATTWEEAYDLYRYGKRNLRVSATLLNRKSSRSHCVFSLRMLTRNVNESDRYINVSSFILCDLAGSERMKHTNEMGKCTVKEMLNINSSILTLNKCFGSLKGDTRKVIRGNELASVIPYRDSKLTMLFKKFLKGQGQLIMLANMSQDSNMYFQTEQILQNTSLVHKTRVYKAKENFAFRLPLVMPKRRFSTLMAHEQNSPVSSRVVKLNSGFQHNIASDPINPEVLRLKEENSKLLEAMKEKELKEQSLHAEKRDLEASLMSRITQLKNLLSTQGENTNLYRVKYFELEDKYRRRVTEANLKELEFFSRLDAANEKIDELTLTLREEFGIEDSAGPRETVRKVIHIHNEIRDAAFEEVAELTNINDDLLQQIHTLQNIVSERDNEISNLKGQVIDALRQLEEVRVNNLVPVKDAEADDEVTKSPTDSDDEGLVSNGQVKFHGTSRWISDDESSPLYLPPKAKTTAKKKKKTRRTKDIPYHSSCKKKPESSETSCEILPARRTRRQLMRPGEDFLGDNTQLELDTPPQLSPGAIMKKTLRSAKRKV